MISVQKVERHMLKVVLVALVSLASCSSVDDGYIIGTWQAVQVKEEGDPLPINVEEISFTFQDNEAYHYESTLNYREAGSYYIEGNYLYTTDTVNQGSMEKAVEIITLSEDSLQLKMDEKGKERIIHLGKRK
ncbi:MAG: lipocalin family protein [Bacteroidota bacterium]